MSIPSRPGESDERAELRRERERGYYRARRAANPEAERERDREKARNRRLRYPERVALYSQKQRAIHAESIRKKKSKWERERRANNPIAARLADRAKYQRHRVVCPEARIAQRQRRIARNNAAPGRGVSLAEWRSIVADSLGICAYCNERKQLTMDHIEPISRGGEHDIGNIAAVCDSCNKSKSDKPLLYWLAWRRAA